jgi:hypothetical protein
MNIAECQVSLSLLDISTINQYADIFFQATSAGLKEQEAINFLEKKMKDDPQFTYDETVQVMLNKAIVLPYKNIMHLKVYPIAPQHGCILSW